MGYKDEDAVLSAVKEVVRDASSVRELKDAERIEAKHPWAYRFVSPHFGESQTFMAFANADDVTVEKGKIDPRLEKRYPGKLKIEITAGLSVYTLWFKKSETGEYEYTNYVHGGKPRRRF